MAQLIWSRRIARSEGVGLEESYVSTRRTGITASTTVL